MLLIYQLTNSSWGIITSMGGKQGTVSKQIPAPLFAMPPVPVGRQMRAAVERSGSGDMQQHRAPHPNRWMRWRRVLALLAIFALGFCAALRNHGAQVSAARWALLHNRPHGCRPHWSWAALESQAARSFAMCRVCSRRVLSVGPGERRPTGICFSKGEQVGGAASWVRALLVCGRLYSRQAGGLAVERPLGREGN